MNYWNNPEHSREELVESLADLIEYVEGVELPADYFADKSEQWIRDEVEWYEYLADK